MNHLCSRRLCNYGISGSWNGHRRKCSVPSWGCQVGDVGSERKDPGQGFGRGVKEDWGGNNGNFVSDLPEP